MVSFREPLLRLLAVIAVVAVVVTACGGGADGGDGALGSSTNGPLSAESSTSTSSTSTGFSVVVLGDSIMAWNVDTGQSIPDVIGEELGVVVTNAAVGGAHAEDVIDQYNERGGEAEWVVFDGGGNDLNDRCGCGACSAIADSILSADGTSGVLAEFAEELVVDGRQVAVVGYYEVPPGAAFGFAACGAALESHNDRLRALAQRFDSVIFIDPSVVVTADDLDAFDEDRVHPSPLGSQIVGEQIAAAIAAAR
ncbi:MAG: SGNH/GDSL hydrolase family protein [Actinomycetota bacterium]